jgi:hypothetical protein
VAGMIEDDISDIFYIEAAIINYFRSDEYEV